MIDEIYEHFKELETLKIEFMDKDDTYHRLDSYIKAVYEDYVLIEPPKTAGILQELVDNSEVNLIFTRQDGVLIAHCGILGKQLGVQSGIKISFPYSTRILERREYVRIPLKLSTKINYYTDKDFPEKKSFLVKTRNISGSGICFLYENSLEGYYDIECKLYMDDGNLTPVIVKCDHVYSKKVKLKNNVSYLTALTYTSISEEGLSRIVKECFKYQISRKHMEKY